MEAGTTTQYCVTLKGYTADDVQFIYRSVVIRNPENNQTVKEQGAVSGKKGNQPGKYLGIPVVKFE